MVRQLYQISFYWFGFKMKLVSYSFNMVDETALEVVRKIASLNKKAFIFVIVNTVFMLLLLSSVIFLTSY